MKTLIVMLLGVFTLTCSATDPPIEDTGPATEVVTVDWDYQVAHIATENHLDVIDVSATESNLVLEASIMETINADHLPRDFRHYRHSDSCLKDTWPVKLHWKADVGWCGCNE